MPLGLRAGLAAMKKLGVERAKIKKRFDKGKFYIILCADMCIYVYMLIGEKWKNI